MATDYYQLRVIGLHQTEYNECVINFKGDNLTVADYVNNAIDLTNAWNDNIAALWLAMFPVSYQTTRLAARKVSVGGGSEHVRQYGLGSQTGTQSGGAASQQLCPVVRLIPPMGVKTAGRIFLPCIAEGDIASNVVTSGWLTRLDALMVDFLAGFATTSITWTPVIHSRKLSTFSAAVAYDTSPIIGFQRKRQRSPL